MFTTSAVGPIAILIAGLACSTHGAGGARAASDGSVASAVDSQPSRSPLPAGQQELTRFASSAPIVLTDGPVRVLLTPSTPGQQLGALASQLAPGHRLLLAVYDVHTDAPPGTLFSLYLDAPDGAVPAATDPRRLGSLNFFGAEREGRLPAGSPAYSYDITDVIGRLRDAKLLTAETSVTIAPTRHVEANTKPTIGRIAIVEQ